MLRASYLAGTAFTKSYVGYVHAVAHSLGGQYGIPHGLANSFFFRSFSKRTEAPRTKNWLTSPGSPNFLLPLDDTTAANAFIAHIRKMNASMNIPTTLAGIRNEDIPKTGPLCR